MEGGSDEEKNEGRKDGWREGGRTKRMNEERIDGRTDGCYHRMIVVIQDKVQIKKQIKNMKIEGGGVCP